MDVYTVQSSALQVQRLSNFMLYLFMTISILVTELYDHL